VTVPSSSPALFTNQARSPRRASDDFNRRAQELMAGPRVARASQNPLALLQGIPHPIFRETTDGTCEAAGAKIVAG
jgi:hypothetical protein